MPGNILEASLRTSPPAYQATFSCLNSQQLRSLSYYARDIREDRSRILAPEQIIA